LIGEDLIKAKAAWVKSTTKNTCTDLNMCDGTLLEYIKIRCPGGVSLAYPTVADVEAAKKALQQAQDDAQGGSGALWWILGIVAVLGLGGGFWYYKKNQKSGGDGDKQAAEGGEFDNMYAKLI